MGTQLPPKRRNSPIPIFGPCLLWLNGWTDQDAILYGVCAASVHSHSALDWDTFWTGPCLLWPNGWIGQDATWYGGRPRGRRHCVRWWSAPPKKGAQQPPVFGPCLLWTPVFHLSNCWALAILNNAGEIAYNSIKQHFKMTFLFYAIRLLH